MLIYMYIYKFLLVLMFLRGQRFKNLQDLRQEVFNIISHMEPEQVVHIFMTG